MTATATGTTLRPENFHPVVEDDEGPRAARRPRRHRVVTYLVTLFLLVNLNFFLPRALPGDPIESMFLAGSPTFVNDDEKRAELTRYYELDGSLVEQYGRYVGSLVRGDLGVSIRQNSRVSDLVAARLPWTVLLVMTSLTFASALGLVLGVHSAWRRGGVVDRRLFAFLLAVSNFPIYLLASFGLLIFSVKLGWVPLSGGRTPFLSASGPLDQVLDIAHHLVAPALVMAIPFLVHQYLVMRASMVSELGSDYLLIGRAKGLSDRRLKYRYVARNALLPVVTLQALQLRIAVGTGVFVEEVFAYPGLGRLVAEAVAGRDYPVMQGVFLLLSFVVLTANLLVDLAYKRLDPRTTA